jgi:hypothetical protein
MRGHSLTLFSTLALGALGLTVPVLGGSWFMTLQIGTAVVLLLFVVDAYRNRIERNPNVVGEQQRQPSLTLSSDRDTYRKDREFAEVADQA